MPGLISILIKYIKQDSDNDLFEFANINKQKQQLKSLKSASSSVSIRANTIFF